MRDEPSRTAEAVCFMRASDQRRNPETRILEDPYARLFLGPMMRAALATVEATGRIGEKTETLVPGLTTFILTRHRFIDDCLARRLDAGAVEQLVLLGAGYDTRAYRFAPRLEHIPVYEVDFPSTSRRKAQIIRENAAEMPAIDVRVVEIDFQSQTLDERLPLAGFARGARTFVVWEGVSMYLTRKAVQDTLRTVRAMSAPGSELTMDFWYLLDAPDLVSTAHRMSANLLHLLGEPVTFGIHPEDVGPFLDRLGWEIVELATAADLEQRYVRDGRSVYPANYMVHMRSKA